MQRRGTRQRGSGVLVRLAFPDRLARERIHRVNPREDVAEEGHGPTVNLRDDDPRSDLGRRLVVPAHAAGFQIQGVDATVLAADEDGAVADGRLGTRAQRVGKDEGPGELEVGHVGRAQTGDVTGNEATRVVPPANPWRRTITVEGGTRRFAVGVRKIVDRTRHVALAGQVLDDVNALVGRQIGRLGSHDPVVHRAEQRARGHHFQPGEQGRLGHAAVVTAGAVVRVKGRSRQRFAVPQITKAHLELVRGLQHGPIAGVL